MLFRVKVPEGKKESKEREWPWLHTQEKGNRSVWPVINSMNCTVMAFNSSFVSLGCQESLWKDIQEKGSETGNAKERKECVFEGSWI